MKILSLLSLLTILCSCSHNQHDYNEKVNAMKRDIQNRESKQETIEPKVVECVVPTDFQSGKCSSIRLKTSPQKGLI